MPKNLQQLKRRIKTAKNVSQIAKAMEMMSASKIKRAQKTVENNKPYSTRIGELTSLLAKGMWETKFIHPYITGNTSDKKLLVVVSPDKGLCGSLNTNLLKSLLPFEDKETMVVTIGKKIEKNVSRLDFEYVASFPIGTTIPKYSLVYEIMQIINELYFTGKVGTVEVLYTEFRSFFQQIPIFHKILPIDLDASYVTEEYLHLYEPGVKELLDGLLPQYLEASLYTALLEAYTSEQAARMIAMQNAKNNANDIANYLTLQYNKTRQERITNEILDLSNNQI
jgi:F-type H+-transporting ATPase subunit gamma